MVACVVCSDAHSPPLIRNYNPNRNGGPYLINTAQPVPILLFFLRKVVERSGCVDADKRCAEERDTAPTMLTVVLQALAMKRR